MIGWLLAVVLLMVGPGARAQQIEPRAFSNIPIGVNFLVAGYAYTTGGLSFEPSVPVTNAQLDTSNVALAYARSLDLAGLSAKFDVIAPYTWLSGTAERSGQPVEHSVTGLGDPKFRLSMNFYGAPALTMPAFKASKQDLIVGGSLQVSAPLGQYDPSRVINLGTNRWSFKPELGISKALGPLTWN